MSNKKILSIWTIVRAIVEKINYHWVARSIISLIPAISAFAIAFPTIQSLFMLQNDNGRLSLNLFGWILLIISIICIIIDVFSNVISSHDHVDSLSYIGENQIFHKVLETTSTYENSINEILRSSYQTIAFNENKLDEFILHYVNPKDRVHHVLDQISQCLAEECDVASNEMVMSAAVSSDSGNWTWLCSPGFEGKSNISKLVKGNSSLRQVIENQTYFFSNDKIEAINNKTYLPDRKDKTYNNAGSIICWEVATEIEYEASPDKKENHTFRMILSVSTYGKKLIESKESDEKINEIYKEIIKKLILDQFHGELSESLIWYGLHVMKTKNRK